MCIYIYRPVEELHGTGLSCRLVQTVFACLVWLWHFVRQAIAHTPFHTSHFTHHSTHHSTKVLPHKPFPTPLHTSRSTPTTFYTTQHKPLPTHHPTHHATHKSTQARLCLGVAWRVSAGGGQARLVLSGFADKPPSHAAKPPSRQAAKPPSRQVAKLEGCQA